MLTHGVALCVDDHAYLELRTIVRTPEWQQRFLSLPLADREKLAGHARKGSKAHTSRAVPVVMDVNDQAVEAAYRATRVRRIIHGHTHRPGMHETVIDGEPAQRIVLGAWYEQGSYLHYERGKYELRELPR
jgi:UDP-2,3-diacylglucosamine hydrolase